MKYIIKSNPPLFSENCLQRIQHRYDGNPPTDHRRFMRMPGATYDDYPCSDDWSKQLLDEQGWLCAYTMMRLNGIGLGKMKREHIIPQNDKPENDLNHWNVVAVCLGGEGQLEHLHFADTRKGNSSLDPRISPLNPDCERWLLYTDEGKIHSQDEDIMKAISDDIHCRPKHYSTLNLNCELLVKARYAAWEVVKNDLTKRANGGSWRATDIKELIQKYQNKFMDDEDGIYIYKYHEYCNFILSRLKRELKRHTKK